MKTKIGEITKIIDFFRVISVRPYHSEETLKENPSWRNTTGDLEVVACKFCGDTFEIAGWGHGFEFNQLEPHIDLHVRNRMLGIELTPEELAIEETKRCQVDSCKNQAYGISFFCRQHSEQRNR